MGKRIIPRRRGRGRRYKAADNRFKGEARHPRSKSSSGKVVELMHDPGRTAPVAKVEDKDGTYTMIAHDGMHIGQEVAAGHGAEINIGNTAYLGSIPEGTKVYNIEMKPGDGGKFARSGGNSAILETRMGEKVRIRLPSGAMKDLAASCRATIGVLGGHGRTDKPLMKAGAAHYRAKARGKLYPTVSGVAMNPVDHPHGGGNHQAVHGPNSVSRNAPPGQKVGNIAPRRTGRGRTREQ